MDNFLNEIYRQGATIGSGSTAAAIRHEIKTSSLVKGKSHTKKGKDAVIFLQKWLKNNPKVRTGDKAAAENIILDIMDALNTKR